METQKHNLLNTPAASFILAFLILLSVISYSLETLPDLPNHISIALKYTEIFIVIIFTAEYIYRTLISNDKKKFILSFYGIIDLAAILPFYLTFIPLDLRVLRLLRMMRLLRLLKLARYNAALIRMKQAITQAKEELIIAITMLSILIYLSAYGIYQFEHSAQPDKFTSIFDALWWSVATITTVGYGDIYPITTGGKLFTFIVMIAGLGIVSVPAGIFASALLSVNNKTRKEEQQ